MTITIETNIPLPVMSFNYPGHHRRTERGNSLRAAIAQLEIGDSFEIDYSHKDRTHCHVIAKRGSKKLVIRKILTRMRVWRIA